MELKHCFLRVIYFSCELLIVPYGIETLQDVEIFPDVCLLIVPYGIETETYYNNIPLQQTFNCTLWN